MSFKRGISSISKSISLRAIGISIVGITREEKCRCPPTPASVSDHGVTVAMTDASSTSSTTGISIA
ncbi:hypothetical protein O9K51_06631 [Purpureocillium lavendulum]|uniref:Uncharacterized protein n=1 Tax=Purpureocillium lavendulum TaxID=1247861 RepID=A0AB34FPY4_9HYPO|nr:hypothetical protein O9K51_06631 [Purpureocillium lavendulum]